MSRIGKMPILLPKGTEVKVSGRQVTVKGNKGELACSIPPDIAAEVKGGSLIVSCASESKECRALYGLSRTLLSNMVQGTSKGFERILEISGVGYRAQKAGEKLVLQVGFNHPVEFEPPKGIIITVEGTNRLKVSGIDRDLVGEITAQIRAIRPCDHYKGKGIKYVEEKLRLKPGKAGKAVAKK